MTESVLVSSMREVSESATDARVADVKALFETHVNEGKVIVVVEGPDDKEVYGKVMKSEAVCFYVDCNCEKHFVILEALNGRYASRLLAIKDADFDRLEEISHPYPNMMLTDTHDMEGMIVTACLSELRGEDAERCNGIIVSDIYTELEDISYLKWFNHMNHCGINFSDVALNVDIHAYFDACVSNTGGVVSVTLEDMYDFKNAHLGVREEELCNGHDILERIYVRARKERVCNFAKKPFFKRFRRAYPREEFVNTDLFHSIKSWAALKGHAILAVT